MTNGIVSVTNGVVSQHTDLPNPVYSHIKTSHVFAFANGQNRSYLLWLEMHARDIKPLEGEEQCAIGVEFHGLIQESCADQLTISEV